MWGASWWRTKDRNSSASKHMKAAKICLGIKQENYQEMW